MGWIENILSWRIELRISKGDKLDLFFCDPRYAKWAMILNHFSLLYKQ